MQQQLANIARWITSHSPILEADTDLVATNPFSETFAKDALPNIEPYSGNYRLGFVYQELVRQLFVAHNQYQIIAEEVQLYEGKQTLGAIDFLIENDKSVSQNLDETGAVEHWEVAIKFYLLSDGLWYGPDSRDRLDIKLDRMVNHQLTMSTTASFKQRFPQIASVKPQLFMQGRLYTNPFSSEPIPSHCLGHLLNPDNMIGYWCYQHQLDQVNEALYMLDKMDWIPGNQQARESLPEKAERAIHCQSKSGQFWIVVPNNWTN